MIGPITDRRTVLSGLALAGGVTGAGSAPAAGISAVKPILVFDIVETLLDLSSLAPVFESMFADRITVRTWFDQLILYSEALTITGTYAGAGTVGVAVLEMLARTKGVAIRPEDLATFKQASARMPAYPDVATSLVELRRSGYRLVTLSNSPAAICEVQLDRAGIRAPFERIFSIDERVRRYKPAREAYIDVAHALGVHSANLMLVSCHAFDIMGAASAGLRSALVLRLSNAPFGIGPQPDLVVADMLALARALTAASL